MRKLLTFTCILLLAAMLFASGSSEVTQASTGPIELKLWSLFTGGDGEFFDAMLDEFNKSQDEIRVINDTVKFDNYYTKLTAALASKSAPDVIVIHQKNLINYIPSGSLLPLDGYFTEETLSDFNQGALDACRFDGKLYSLPLDVQTIVLFYNKDILEEAGIKEIPTTAEEFIDASLIIKEKTGKWPFAMSYLNAELTTSRLFISLMSQQGGSVLSPDYSASAINNEKGVRALSLIQDMVNKYEISPKELDYDTAMNMFKLGEAAFYFNGVWSTGALESIDGLNFGAMDLPALLGKRATWSTSHTLAIPVQKNQDLDKAAAAAKFFEWMTSNAILWAKSGGIPTRNSVLESEEFKAMPYRSDYAEAAATALETPKTPAWQEIFTTLSELIEVAIETNADPAEYIVVMDETINKIISNY